MIPLLLLLLPPLRLFYHYAFALLFSLVLLHTSAQSSPTSPDGYTGYALSLTGRDPGSVIYETASTTTTNTSATYSPPDVFLNATVNVGELDILVANLSAKINLDAQVLSLLQFNAGVDLSIDTVKLSIFNVSARVLLEARLENLVHMINDTLESLDLNPGLAAAGGTPTVGGGAGAGAGAGGAPVAVVPRSLELEENILFSVNDYSGNTHTNRLLTQEGQIVDVFLDNVGGVHGEAVVVGSYLSEMTFSGDEQSVVKNGVAAKAREYVYKPFEGLSVVSAIYVDDAGKVVGTRVLSESGAGGGSTVGIDL